MTYRNILFIRDTMLDNQTDFIFYDSIFVML
jgi:hypothetical protein